MRERLISGQRFHTRNEPWRERGYVPSRLSHRQELLCSRCVANLNIYTQLTRAALLGSAPRYKGMLYGLMDPQP